MTAVTQVVLLCILLLVSSCLEIVSSEHKPLVTVPESPYRVIPGDDVVVWCHVDAVPQATDVTWYKGTTELTAGAGVFSGKAALSPSLVIKNVAVSDDGTYTCSATNEVGTGNSSVLVQVARLIVTVPASSYGTAVGDDVELGCEVDAVPDVGTITWYKGTTAITAGVGRYSGGTASSPSLTISSIEASDAGSYTCSANNGYVSDSPPIVLHVRTNKMATGGTGEITTGVGIFSGKSALIPSLVISNVTIGDAGRYSCSATNDAGTQSSSPTVLNVNRLVVETPEFAYGVTGTRGVLFCYVVAIPPLATVTWSKGSTPITAGVGRFGGGTVLSPSLTISSLTTSDAGTYTCSATNAIESRSGSVQLQVGCYY